MIARALPIDVYKHGKYDCTNGGISSKYNELLVMCPDGHVKVDLENPPENLVIVVKRFLFGKTIYYIEPYKIAKHIGWMSGGNFAFSCDSRFSRLIDGNHYAISIHDRQETQAEYDVLSK